MSPKSHYPSAKKLRELIGSGKYGFESGRAPAPPEEWKPWKRRALSRDIRAACLFLRGKDYCQVRSIMGLSDDLTRQRILQYVRRGSDFLLSRGWVKEREK